MEYNLKETIERARSAPKLPEVNLKELTAKGCRMYYLVAVDRRGRLRAVLRTGYFRSYREACECWEGDLSGYPCHRVWDDARLVNYRRAELGLDPIG